MMASTPDLVDYTYIAEQLNVNVQTVRVLATSKKGRQAIDYFPKSVAPETSRSPLFRKDEADAFVARRLAEAKQPKRMNAFRKDVLPNKPGGMTRSEISQAALAKRQDGGLFWGGYL